MGKALPERMSEPSLRSTSEIGWSESKACQMAIPESSQTLGTKVTGWRTFF
jgi:hypothetical protein